MLLFDEIERVHALEQVEGVHVYIAHISKRHMTCLDELLITRVPRIVHVYGISVESTVAGVENGQRRMYVPCVVKGRKVLKLKASAAGLRIEPRHLLSGRLGFSRIWAVSGFEDVMLRGMGGSGRRGFLFMCAACNLSAVWFKMWDSV